jgi:putative membrane protein
LWQRLFHIFAETQPMKFLTQLIVSALAVIVAAMILPGVHVDNAITAIIVAAVLAFLNAIVKPVLVILTIPITVFTMGFFLLVINALIILLAAKIVDGFHVNGFWIALLFSLLLTLVTSVFESFANRNDRSPE